MSIDTLLYITAGAQFLSAMWGAIVSLPHTDWPQRNRLFVISIFATLGLVGTVAAIKQGRMAATESAQASEKLSNSLNNLSAASTEISRVQGLNSELQKQLLASSAQLLTGSRQTLSLATDLSGEVTGKNTFCYFTIISNWGRGNPPTWPVNVWVKGKYPMRNVVATIYKIGDSQEQTLQNYLNKKRIPLPETLVPGLAGVSDLRIGVGS